jgi:hypothetical protein
VCLHAGIVCRYLMWRRRRSLRPSEVEADTPVGLVTLAAKLATRVPRAPHPQSQMLLVAHRHEGERGRGLKR